MTTPRHVELRLQGLGAGYGAGLVLRDVDLQLSSGTIAGVVGPNGAGKSTLLKAMVGLTPETVGSATLDGQPVLSQLTRVAYVPQREMVDWSFPITAGDVVMLGLAAQLGLLRRPRAAERRQAAEAMRRVGIIDLADEQIGALSGGQQQRVFLARALTQGASVLLLDEPMTGIDRATEQAIQVLLRELRDEGAIVMMTTHDLESAAQLSDVLAFVSHRLVAFGPPETTFTPPILHATFGGELLILSEGDDHTHVHAGGHHDRGQH